jgi:hypothetical protein
LQAIYPNIFENASKADRINNKLREHQEYQDQLEAERLQEEEEQK